MPEAAKIVARDVIKIAAPIVVRIVVKILGELVCQVVKDLANFMLVCAEDKGSRNREVLKVWAAKWLAV